MNHAEELFPSRESTREPLLTAEQVADQLGMHPQSVRAHANGRRKPRIPSLKIGKSVRFRQADIDEFLKRCERAQEHGLPVQ